MFKTGIAGTAVVALGTAIYVVAPYENGKVYPLAEEIVYERLADMPLPPEIDKITQQPGVDLAIDQTAGEGVRWSLRQNGTMVLQMIARITPESAASTRVKVDFEIGDIEAIERNRPGSAATEIKALESDPIIQGMVRIALQEQMSATLEARPYDKQKVQREAMIFAASNPAAVKALKSKFESAEYDARVARRRMSDEDRAETYHRDVTDQRDWVNREARPGRPMMSSRPTHDLSEYRR